MKHNNAMINILRPYLSISVFTVKSRVASVRLRFTHGMVQAVPVFGSGGSSWERAFCARQESLRDGTVPVPVSVPEKRFRRFRFRVRFLEERFRRFRFLVPVDCSVPVRSCKSGTVLRQDLAILSRKKVLQQRLPTMKRARK